MFACLNWLTSNLLLFSSNMELSPFFLNNKKKTTTKNQSTFWRLLEEYLYDGCLSSQLEAVCDHVVCLALI